MLNTRPTPSADRARAPAVVTESLLGRPGRDEVLDLFAYTPSRGDANDPMSKKK